MGLGKTGKIVAWLAVFLTLGLGTYVVALGLAAPPAVNLGPAITVDEGPNPSPSSVAPTTKPKPTAPSPTQSSKPPAKPSVKPSPKPSPKPPALPSKSAPVKPLPPSYVDDDDDDDEDDFEESDDDDD